MKRAFRSFRCGSALALALGALALACTSPPESEPRPSGPPPSVASNPTGARPSILLVTLDTTRADSVAPEGDAGATPVLAALARRSVRLHPGLCDRADDPAVARLDADRPLPRGPRPARERPPPAGRDRSRPRTAPGARLLDRGVRLRLSVAAPVRPRPRLRSLRRRVRLRRRRAPRRRARVARALQPPRAGARAPLFLWVHLYDPHEPYAPPEPFRSRFAADPYLGEIAAMDAALGPLLEAFEQKLARRASASLVAADHGEGRGDHGEALARQPALPGRDASAALGRGDGRPRRRCAPTR